MTKKKEDSIVTKASNIIITKDKTNVDKKNTADKKDIEVKKNTADKKNIEVKKNTAVKKNIEVKRNYFYSFLYSIGAIKRTGCL